MDELTLLGLKKVSDTMARIKLKNDCLGSIGLNMATRLGGGYYHVNPMVGIRFNKIHDFIALITGDKPRNAMTFGRNIGNLIPDRKRSITLEFHSDTPIQENIEEFKSLVQKHAFSFWEKNTALSGEELLELISKKTPYQFKGMYQISVIHLYNLDPKYIWEIIEKREQESLETEINDFEFAYFVNRYYDYMNR